jgi:hypothetical protein
MLQPELELLSLSMYIRRLSRTRLFPEVTRIVPFVVPMGE